MSGMSNEARGSASTAPARPEQPDVLLLYDGVCGFCNGFVDFVMRRDRAGRFYFAPLQSPVTARRLAALGADPAGLPDSLILITGDHMHVKSAAAIEAFLRLGGIWKLGAALLRLVPRALRDRGYDLFARHRYRLFGRKAACEIPDPVTRRRFLWD